MPVTLQVKRHLMQYFVLLLMQLLMHPSKSGLLLP